MNRSDSDNSSEDLKELKYKNVVKSSWEELMNNRKKVAEEIYDSILSKEVNLSLLFLNTPIAKQQNMFMTMLDGVINLIDDSKNFEKKLQLLSKSHHEKYRVEKQHYKHFRRAFMKAIQKYLSPWTEEREEAWMWFWNKVINAMTSYNIDNNNNNSNNNKNNNNRSNVLLLPELNYTRNCQQLIITFETILHDDPQNFAQSFYKTLLSTEPAIALLFNNKDVNKQSIKFISMLRHAIRLLEDKNSFKESMLELAKRHVKYNVQISHLNIFGRCFTQTLREECIKINLWNDTCDDAWLWFWSIILELFDIGMNQNNDLPYNHHNHLLIH